jgi:hypothetical protein
MARGQKLISIDRLADLNRAFKVASSEMGKDFKTALRTAAEPVAKDAERRGLQEGIGRSNIRWNEMRIGVTTKSVYIAPRNRRTVGTRRRNFAGLLLGKAMEPALDANIEKVVQEADDAIRDMSKAWERVG